jgi:hypothetical protein
MDEQGLEEQAAEQKRGGHDLLVGGLWFAAGLIITIWTYDAASSSPSGGRYLVAWGPMVYGGIRFVKGLFSMAS